MELVKQGEFIKNYSEHYNVHKKNCGKCGGRGYTAKRTIHFIQKTVDDGKGGKRQVNQVVAAGTKGANSKVDPIWCTGIKTYRDVTEDDIKNNPKLEFVSLEKPEAKPVTKADKKEVEKKEEPNEK